MSKLKSIIGTALAIIAVVGCEEPDDVIEQPNFDRLFRPAKLECRIQSQTNVRISWESIYSSQISSYKVEIFANDTTMAFSGAATKSEDVESSPVTFEGLEGDATYSVRIKSFAEDGKESEWATATFKTGTEQMLEEVTEDDMANKSLIIKWPAGEVIDRVVLLQGEEVVVDREVTAEEVAAGSLTLTDLKEETEYTATVYKGTKQRGSVTVTTPLDLGNAIVLNDGDDLLAAINEAEEGAVLALFKGTYGKPEEKLSISKGISIKSARASEPATVNGCFTIDASGVSLTLENLVLDGTGTDGSQLVDFKSEGGTYEALTIKNCEIKNYGKGLIYVNVAASINSVVFDNNLVHGVVCSGGDLFDCRKGYIANLAISNSTFYNTCKERDFIRYDDASGSFEGVADPVITVDHCTLDSVANTASRRLLYVRYAGNKISFTNNLVADLNASERGFSDQSKTNEPTFSGNYYYNCDNLMEQSTVLTSKSKYYDSKGTKVDENPFTDAAAGNFKYTNEDLSYYQVGDPRWY